MTTNVIKLRHGNNGGGSPRKSVAQHKLAGTYRPGRHGKQKPAAPAPSNAKASKLPPPPDDFTDFQKRIWADLAARIDPLTICTASDVEAFTLMVQSYSICIEASRALRRGALTYTTHTKNGKVVRPRPEVGILATFQKLALYHFSRFGMTPADRERVASIGSSGGVLASDPMAEFLAPEGD